MSAATTCTLPSISNARIKLKDWTAMDNLSVKLTWIDGLQQEYLLATVEVSAVSSKSSAVQKCDLDTYCIRDLGDLMVHHSYEFGTKHSFTIDDRYGATEPLSIVMHEANTSGRVPIELVFNMEEDIVGNYSAAVVVWAELGQLESFGRKLAGLPKKGVGASCELNREEN